ncbi:MAG: ABC transporter substrate-binding protein [Betaproteobacteria bacterium]|nr:ABC transporter substrate-binding protein [Betaproteobacteria bacterium]
MNEMQSTGSALVVYSTISAKEALIDLVPRFEQQSQSKINITYTPAPTLIKQIRAGTRGDVFIGPEEYAGPLFEEGILLTGSRVPFARSATGLAVRAGTLPPDISTPAKLKSALLAARGVSFSEGASGMMFVKVLSEFGIADAIRAKFVAPQPGEMIGSVVARGAADIGIQQISALLPVAGITIVGRLPDELQEPIIYGTHLFAQSAQQDLAQPFVNFLRSATAIAVLTKSGFEPA